MSITEKTLNNRLSDLRKDGYLERRKLEGVIDHILTQRGRKTYGTLFQMVMNTNLTPEIHRCEGRLGSILPVFRDPANIIKIILHVLTERDLDIVSLYNFEQARRPGSKEMILLKQLVDEEDELDMHFERMIDRYTLIGKRPEDFSDMDPESIVDAIIMADLLRKQMKMKEARELYSEILLNRAGPHSAYRIFCLVGVISCSRKIDGHGVAMKMVEDFLTTVTNPSFKVMLNKCKADLLNYSNLDEAKKLYRSCINSLKNLKLHGLECGIYNNLGVAYFKEGNFKEAEECWKRVLSISRDRDYPWIEAVTKLNVADYLARAGKIKQAKEMLEESLEFLTSVNDLEGISGYHFNKAIVSILDGDRDLALEHFRKSDEFFAMYKEHREMQRDEIRKLFKGKGWDEPNFQE